MLYVCRKLDYRESYSANLKILDLIKECASNFPRCIASDSWEPGSIIRCLLMQSFSVSSLMSRYASEYKPPSGNFVSILCRLGVSMFCMEHIIP